MNSLIGIYADEYLALLELYTLIDRELPQAKVTLFCNEELRDTLPGEQIDQITTNLELMRGMDVVIALSPLPDKSIILKKFEGTLIDVTEQFQKTEYADLISVYDPLFSMIVSILEPLSFSVVNLSLPMAVYGRQGVDTLMQETRGVFAFSGYEDSVLDREIAFKVHFYQNNLPKGVLGKEIDTLRKYATTVNVRLMPISTAYIVDIIADDEIGLPEELSLIITNDDFTTEDAINGEAPAAILSEDRRCITICGDYLHLKSAAVFNALKNTLGV